MNDLSIISTDSHLKDTEKIYTCQFVNRRKISVPVFEFCRLLLEVEPESEFVVEMWDPNTSYAPFSRISFEEGDKVTVKKNSAWSLPKKPTEYELELLNEAGSPVEGFYPNAANETPIHCYRGIPRYISIPLDSKFIRFRRVIWRLVKEKIQDRNNSDYMVWGSRVEQVFEPRSKAELDKIEAALKARARAEVEKLSESLRK